MHWCFVYHFCPDDRVAPYHEKCSSEFKIPPLDFEPVKYLDAVLSPYLVHFLWHTSCTVALTNRHAWLRVFPLYYLPFSNVKSGQPTREALKWFCGLAAKASVINIISSPWGVPPIVFLTGRLLADQKVEEWDPSIHGLIFEKLGGGTKRSDSNGNKGSISDP